MDVEVASLAYSVHHPRRFRILELRSVLVLLCAETHAALYPPNSTFIPRQHSFTSSLAMSVTAERFRPGESNANEPPYLAYGSVPHQTLNGEGKNEIDAAIEHAEYVGQGTDDAPRSPVRKMHKKSGSVRISNGVKKELVALNILEEKFQDRDGERLTSIRPDEDYEEALKRDLADRYEKKREKDPQLVSGRRAGAGWELSGYINFDS